MIMCIKHEHALCACKEAAKHTFNPVFKKYLEQLPADVQLADSH